MRMRDYGRISGEENNPPYLPLKIMGGRINKGDGEWKI